MAELRRRSTRWGNFSNEELLEMIRKELIRLNMQDNPSKTVFIQRYDNDTCPNPNTVGNRTGKSWRDIVNDFGFEYTTETIVKNTRQVNKGRKKSHWHHMSDEELKEIVFKELKRIKSDRVVDYNEKRDKEKAPSVPYITKRLGKWRDLVMAMPISNQSKWDKISDQQMKKMVVDEFYRIKSNTLTDYEKNRDRKELPSHSYLTNRFGSWKGIARWQFEL